MSDWSPQRLHYLASKGCCCRNRGCGRCCCLCGRSSSGHGTASRTCLYNGAPTKNSTTLESNMSLLGYHDLSLCSRVAVSPCPGLHGQPIEQILLVLAGRRRRVKTDTIRRGEGTAVQLGRQAPPEAVRRNLRPMREQGLALDLAVRSDIECHRRGLWAGATGPLPVSLSPAHVEADRLERGPQGLPLAVIDLGNGVELRHRPRGAGLRIRPRLPSGMEGIEAHLVAPDVVRVGIATARRFGDDHAGAQHTNDLHQPACGLARVGLNERVPVLIGGRPRHPRIPIAANPANTSFTPVVT